MGKEDTNNAKNVDDVKEETVAENDDNIAEKGDEPETVETTKRMLSSEEIASKLKASLLNFFEKHNPEKANDESVNPLVTKYSDKGVDALQKLAGKFEKKYGGSLFGEESAEEFCHELVVIEKEKESENAVDDDIDDDDDIVEEEEAPKDKSDDINEDVADDSDKVENKEDTNNAKNVDDVKE